MYDNYQNQQTPPPYYGEAAVTRQTSAVMKRVYVRMCLGLLVSAFCALGVASSPAALAFIFGNQIVFWECSSPCSLWLSFSRCVC